MIDGQTEWIVNAILDARQMEEQQPSGIEIETTTEAEEQWTEMCRNLVPATVWSACNNWYNDSSRDGIEDGKNSSPMYLGTWSQYQAGMRRSGLRFTAVPQPQGAA